MWHAVHVKCLKRNHSADRWRNDKINAAYATAKITICIMCFKSISTQLASVLANSQTQVLSAFTRNKFLQAGFIWASYKDNRLCRTLLDSGSQRSYIFSSLISQLHSQPLTTESLTTFTIGGHTKKIQKYNVHKIQLESHFSSPYKTTIPCLKTPRFLRASSREPRTHIGLTPVANLNQSNLPDTPNAFIGADVLANLCLGRELIYI